MAFQAMFRRGCNRIGLIFILPQAVGRIRVIRAVRGVQTGDEGDNTRR